MGPRIASRRPPGVDLLILSVGVAMAAACDAGLPGPARGGDLGSDAVDAAAERAPDAGDAGDSAGDVEIAKGEPGEHDDAGAGAGAVDAGVAEVGDAGESAVAAADAPARGPAPEGGDDANDGPDTPQDCDDGDPCTADVELPDGGCEHDPMAPIVQLGRWVGHGFGRPRTVETHLAKLWVAAGAGGLQRWKLAAGGVLEPAGIAWWSGTAEHVEVAGDRAWVATGEDGLVVLDVSDPDHPLVTEQIPTGGPVRRVRMGEQHLFATAAGGVLAIGDLGSGPGAPAGLVPVPGLVQDFRLGGNVLYAATAGNGLHAFDVTDPAAPSALWSWTPPAKALTDVTLAGGYVVASTPTGLAVLDPSKPPFPKAYSNGTSGPNGGTALDAANGLVYMAGPKGLWSIDVFVPIAAETLDTSGGGSPHHGSVEGLLGTTAASNGDLEGDVRAFDLTNSKDLAPMGLVHYDARLELGTVAGGPASIAYLPAGSLGVRIVDVSVPSAAKEIGRWAAPAPARDAAFQDGFLYVADEDYGLRIADVSDPTSPVPVGTVSKAAGGRAIAVAGGLAVLAIWGLGARLFDVSVPSQPYPLDTLFTWYGASGVAIYGDAVFVSGAFPQVWIGDVSDPAHAIFAGHLKGSSGPLGDAVVANGRLYVTESGMGVHVFGLGTPTVPVYLGTVELPVPPDPESLLAIDGDRLLVGTVIGAAGAPSSAFTVLDATYPFLPKVLGHGTLPVEVRSLAVSGDRSYVASRERGLSIVALDPKCPLGSDGGASGPP